MSRGELADLIEADIKAHPGDYSTRGLACRLADAILHRWPLDRTGDDLSVEGIASSYDRFMNDRGMGRTVKIPARD